MSIQTDTIAAVATPAGPGAIGILRLSGPRAADIAAAVFRPLGKKGLLERPVRTLVYGDLLDREGQVIDRVLCTYSRGPESYTGEDTAELHCHGSPMVLTLGLEALFAQGPARPDRGSSPSGPSSTGGWTWPRRRRWPTCWTPRAGRGPATRRASCPEP